jgi:hypothetical protein
MINYRYSTLSVFRALNIDFGTGAAVPQYQDLTFKTDFNAGKAGTFSFWGIGGLSYVALLERDKKEGQDLYGYSSRDTYFRSNVGATGLSHTLLLKKNAYLRTNLGISGSLNRYRLSQSGEYPARIPPGKQEHPLLPEHYLQ